MKIIFRYLQLLNNQKEDTCYLDDGKMPKGLNSLEIAEGNKTCFEWQSINTTILCYQ